ncbi:hypothetical protein BGW80DRAFT_1460374 [Lactifluus volemus]|nr:hypothetical protein BGW80DRAFT_1460374 [Lactifluus volemus]
METENLFLGQSTIHQKCFLSSSPRLHPQRAIWLVYLAGLRSEPFEIFDCTNNWHTNLSLDGSTTPSIENWTYAKYCILLALAWSLRLRWDRFKQPYDIKYCVKYLRYLRDHQLQVLNISQNIVTSYLVLALAEQVNLNLTSPPTEVFLAFINSIYTPYDVTKLEEPLGQVIECFREANNCFPDSSLLSSFLEDCLTMRFLETFVFGDYGSNVYRASQPFLNAIPLDQPTRPEISWRLANLGDSCVHPDGYLHDRSYQLPETVAVDVDLSSFSTLSASLTKTNPSSLTSEQLHQHFQALRTIRETTELAETEEVLKYCRLLIASLRHDPNSHPDISYAALKTLGKVLRAFQSTDKIKYLKVHHDQQYWSKLRRPWFRMELQKRKRLLEERDKFISPIRALLDFGSFLTSVVIIINRCTWDSDIPTLLHDLPPSPITTTDHDNLYDRAIELSDRLANQSSRSSAKMKVPEQSRVWCSPTSVFFHLPLHVMGPIPSDDGIKRYNPTLSALIEFHRCGGQMSGKPSFSPRGAEILVAPQEAFSTSCCAARISASRGLRNLDTAVTSLISKDATPSSAAECLRHHQFSHFVCHGNMEPGKPFDESLQLHGGEPLTLLKIADTAELTEDSTADEALHLTAASRASKSFHPFLAGPSENDYHFILLTKMLFFKLSIALLAPLVVSAVTVSRADVNVRQNSGGTGPNDPNGSIGIGPDPNGSIGVGPDPNGSIGVGPDPNGSIGSGRK